MRADAHPSFASLAAFLEAHPGWPSRNWIRERQEAELVAHPLAPAEVAAFFAAEPPQSSAGKLAAARAYEAMGRADEASQVIRALWRDGNFDGLTESLILRDFGGSLLKADHEYRATACSTPAILARAPGSRRSPGLMSWRSPRPASRRLARQ